MKQRIITAIAALLVFVPIVIFSNNAVFRICIAVISAVSAYELANCIKIFKKPILSVPLLLFAFCMPLTWNMRADVRWALVVVLMFWCMGTMVFSNGRITASDACVAFTGVFYTTLSYDCIAMLRENYSWWFLLVFVAAWGSDTFAYFVGKICGKHKLIPKISPKKTVEGAIGGAISGIVLFPLFGLLFEYLTNFNVNLVLLSCAGFAAAVASQIGDLIMSAVKRCYDIKDFGRIFPGHGGFLDRFDSTLTVAPLLCLALGVFEILYL